MRSHHRKSFRDFVAADLDILPLMNLFVVLIPMLLLSAVFVQVSALDMQLPPADQEALAEDEQRGIEVTVQESSYRVEAARTRPVQIDRASEDADAQLQAALAELAQEREAFPPLTILSPADLRYQDLITVMDISSAAGMGPVSLLGLEAR